MQGSFIIHISSCVSALIVLNEILNANKCHVLRVNLC